MTLPTATTVRAAFATSLTAGLTGWRQSVFQPGQIGRDGGPSSGKVWSVEIGATALLEGRHRVKSGAGYTTEPFQVEDEVVVRWLLEIRGDAAVADYAAGVATDALILKTLYTGANALTCAGFNTPILVDSTRELAGDGAYLVGAMRFTVRRPFGLP